MTGLQELGFQVVEGWEQLPEGYAHKDVAGVTVDSRDRVYLLTRYDARVLVYERDGAFVASWGEGEMTAGNHGLKIGPDDSLYIADNNSHTVRKFSTEGELLLTLGTPGVASDTGYDRRLAGTDIYVRQSSLTHGGPPFNGVTNAAVAPNADLYVSDGYYNARIHRFTAQGRLVHSWGEPGSGPGQFRLPHDVWVTGEGRVLVADRENDRIQLFDLEGNFVEQWTDVQRPTNLWVDREGLVYVAELGRRHDQQSFRYGFPPQDLPSRVSIYDPRGRLLHRWGSADRAAPGNFFAPHGIAVDSRGDLYVADATYSDQIRKGWAPEGSRTFQKFARAS